jgi:CRP/FNR family cyclic AMP-dependent transcriptional regulator
MNHLMEVERQGAAPRERRAAHEADTIGGALARSTVFGALQEGALRQLAGASSLIRVPRRRHLYRQDERPEALFVVASGRLRVVRESGQARSLTVAYRTTSELVGETALVDRDGYRDTAASTDYAEVVRVSLAQVDQLLAADAALAGRLMRQMIERRLEAERRVASLLSRSVESRVCEFLMDASERHGIPESRGLLIGVKYTHQEIADYVGSTRETVTLTLGELRRRGTILFDHRRVVVTKPDRLAEFI